MTRLETEHRRPDPNGRGYLPAALFEGLTVIANPCPTYESRSWSRGDGRAGVTYGSHSMRLAAGNFGGLYVLVEHGGGFERLSLKAGQFNDEFVDALKAMPERLQYAALYTLWEAASDASRETAAAVRAEWAQAFCEGRIRKSRVKAGHRTVSVEPAAVAASSN